MRLTAQKRLASYILKCSQKKIRVDKDRLDEVKDAITKADVRSLIKDKAIVKADTNETSKVRIRLHHEQKRKGRRHGMGAKKGIKTSRSPRKRMWINKIRTLRDLLSRLKETQKIDNKTYRDLYMKAGGGFFRNERHLKIYITEQELVKK